MALPTSVVSKPVNTVIKTDHKNYISAKIKSSVIPKSSFLAQVSLTQKTSLLNRDLVTKAANKVTNSIKNSDLDKSIEKATLKGGMDKVIPIHQGEVPQANNKSVDDNTLGLLSTATDIGTDFIPGVSNMKDATIAFTGINPVTGEKLGFGSRLLSGFFALPVVGNVGKYITKAGVLVYKGVKLAKKGIDVTAGIAKAGSRHSNNIAGSIRNVNPTNGKQNCVNCSIATDSTLGGRPASALPSKPTSIKVLELHFGGKFGKPVLKSDIETTLLKMGDGARGIVFGSRGIKTGHVFNVVNQRGVIRFLDGQTGKVANLSDGFTRLHLLKTTL